MILADTSVWVEHVRRRNDALKEPLLRQLVSSHPFVIGELALGGFKPEVINFVRRLPRAVVARDEEVLGLIERSHLAGRGIGYVDAHLLASAFLTQGTTLLTLDRKMRAAAEELHIAASL